MPVGPPAHLAVIFRIGFLPGSFSNHVLRAVVFSKHARMLWQAQPAFPRATAHVEHFHCGAICSKPSPAYLAGDFNRSRCPSTAHRTILPLSLSDRRRRQAKNLAAVNTDPLSSRPWSSNTTRQIRLATMSREDDFDWQALSEPMALAGAIAGAAANHARITLKFNATLGT